MGKITKKVQERMLKWYGRVMRRDEHYVGRRTIAMKVQGRRKRGIPNSLICGPISVVNLEMSSTARFFVEMQYMGAQD